MSDPLPTEAYAAQSARWPAAGRHVLAHFDAKTIVVYQAYRPDIGRHAINHGRFGGAFSFDRMSWIKPNFLWMMYRSGWGTKENQEITLALRLRRSFFDGLLAAAVESHFDPAAHSSREAWQAAVAKSDVRLQWDPDHAPSGVPVARRAVQLGIRGKTLAAMATTELLEVLDLTDFVADQRAALAASPSSLRTPVEHVYPTAK